MFIGKKQAWIIVHETIKRDLPHASHDKSSLAENANTRIGVVAVTEPTLSIVEAVCTRRDGLTRNRSHQWNALSTILRFACSTFSLFLFLFFLSVLKCSVRENQEKQTTYKRNARLPTLAILELWSSRYST